MWDELREEIELNRAQLRLHLETLPVLRKKIRQTPPNEVEIMALATFLHSFYNGVENLFKRVSMAVHGGLPHGEFWHTALLESMTRPTGSRPAVISQSLHEALRGYLDFRHMFRHAYSFELRWDKMAPLVLEIEATFEELEMELDRFLEAIG